MNPQHLQQPKFSYVNKNIKVSSNDIKANYAPIFTFVFTARLEQTSYKCLLNV